MASTKNCVFVDFESRSRNDLSGGSFKYAADPSTEILLLSYTVEDRDPICIDFTAEGWEEQVAKFNTYVKNDYIFVAHNMLFEIAVFKYLGGKYGLASPPHRNFRCTLQMAGRAGLPLALEHAGPALDLDVGKIDYGKLLIHKFCKPRNDGRFNELCDSPGEAEKFKRYCNFDTIVSRELWRNLREWTDSELRDIRFDLQSNVEGVPIDPKVAQIILDNVSREQHKFADRANILTKGRITKMTQIQRLKKWVQQHVNPDISSCDADHIVDILAGLYGHVDDVSAELLEMRQHSGKTSTGKYQRYIDSHIDGWIYGMLISFGAHTGRSISKQLNLYNLPKPSVEYISMDVLVDDLARDDIEYINRRYGSYLRAASSAIRGIISAPTGYKLFVSDYASIEARVVFWLSNCRGGLDKYREGHDLYKDCAAKIFGVQYINVTDTQRWLGKQTILGSGYGLGPKGFVNSCARWGVEITGELAQNAITAYREGYPEVVDLWADLEAAALTACKTGKVTYAASRKISFKTTKTLSGVVFLMMKLPSGRCIYYPHVKTGMVKTPWGEQKLAVTYRKVKDNGFYRDSTYGGKLTENAVQAIARDIMYYGAQQASKKGFRILFTVYDEVISLAKEDANLETFNKSLCEIEPWAVGMPLEAEGKVLQRYQKL